MPWWEVDHYISIMGLVFLLYFGLWRRLRETDALTNYRVLNIPLVLITIFSVGAVFGFISHLPLPLISVERTPSRFLILPILVLLGLSCIWLQKMFDRLRPGWIVQVLALTGIAFEGKFLVEHSSVWYAHASGIKLPTGFLQLIEPGSDWAKSVEGLYVSTVHISYLVSLIAVMAFFAATLYFKMKRPVLEKVGEV